MKLLVGPLATVVTVNQKTIDSVIGVFLQSHMTQTVLLSSLSALSSLQ